MRWTKIVFMQAECSHEQYMDEVQFVEEVAREDARLKAIVAWAPMEVEGENLRALEQLAGRPLVKGIRRLIQTEFRKLLSDSGADPGPAAAAGIGANL